MALLGSAALVFAEDLPACPSSGYFHNCFGTYTFDANSKWAGDKYVGEFRDDTFHGQGTYIFASGAKYVGEFRDGNFHGQGTYIFASGAKYVGEHKDGKPNGRGTYTFTSGDKYVGEYKDGKKHGKGTYTHASGDEYVGEYKDGKKHGKGTYTYGPNSKWAGDKYVGEYKDGKKHGQGTYIFASGAKYVGEVKDGNPNGQGTYTFADGRRDVGEFKDGVLNGYAIQYRPDGSIIKEGIFKDDEFLYAAKDPNKSDLPPCPSSGYFHNCFGTYTFDSNSKWAGDKYVGEFRDDTFHGQGTYTFADGDKYVGKHKDGEPNGQGTYTFASGAKYVGEHKDGKKHGQGTYTFASGAKYVGEFKDGKKHGQGTYTFADGDKYVGEYKDGERNGQGTFTYGPNSKWAGDKYVGEYKDGERNGQGTYTFANGAKYVGEVKDGNPNGQGTYTFADGRRDVGEFKDGVLNGYAIQYRPDGSIIKEGIFKDDEFLYAAKDPNKSDLPACPSSGYFHNCFGTYTFDSNSKWAGDKYVGEFRDDNFHGQGTYTFADGRRDVGEFKDGMLNGYAIQYRPDGSIIKEGIFKDDEFLYAQKTTPAVPIAKTPIKSDELISASSGSGFSVSSDGYVITNYHVVEGCEKVIVHTKENEFPIRVITFDPKNDLALLKGDFRPKTVFALSNSSPELLQDVYVAGFPFGEKFSTSIKVTKGIVSSLTGLGNNFSNIQIDAALQSGNSGGPILDDFGNVVGVAVAKLDSKYMFEEYGIIPENTNFGIKSSVVKSVLESNNVESSPVNQSSITKSKLGEMIADGTYYISCWMTMAQINEMKNKKVFFNNLD